MFKRRTFFLSACFFVTKCISHPKVNYSLPFSSFSFYSRKIYETANVTFENTSTFSLNFFFTYRVVGTSSLFLLPFSRLGVFFHRHPFPKSANLPTFVLSPSSSLALNSSVKLNQFFIPIHRF